MEVKLNNHWIVTIGRSSGGATRNIFSSLQLIYHVNSQLQISAWTLQKCLLYRVFIFSKRLATKGGEKKIVNKSDQDKSPEINFSVDHKMA